jgi:hypothetical protein
MYEWLAGWIDGWDVLVVAWMHQQGVMEEFDAQRKEGRKEGRNERMKAAAPE